MQMPLATFRNIPWLKKPNLFKIITISVWKICNVSSNTFVHEHKM